MFQFNAHWFRKSLTSRLRTAALFVAVCFSGFSQDASGQTVVVRARWLHTMAGEPIENAAVLLVDGKISAIAKSDQLTIPEGATVIDGEHVTPGLIDVRTSVGLAGILNSPQDQDQLESSSPMQPELRALDAYNSKDDLIEWIRGFGVTTVHTGHGPGELISGQTIIVKLTGNTVEDGLIQDGPVVVCTLSEGAKKTGKGSPGTRGKMMAMLRTELIAAQRYIEKINAAQAKPDSDPVARDLKLETMAAVLRGEKALMISADREQDISSALRLAKEFGFRLWLESASESYLLLDQIKQANVPILLHPSMARSTSDRQSLSFSTAAKLKQAGILFAIEGGFESYVPKARVVLFEAAIAAANGLDREAALASITIEAAKILGIQARVGSLEIGKDADVAVYDGDPFEYTSHCTHTIINGQVVHSEPR